MKKMWVMTRVETAGYCLPRRRRWVVAGFAIRRLIGNISSLTHFQRRFVQGGNIRVNSQCFQFTF